MISPHGGVLTQRDSSDDFREELLEQAKFLPKVTLNEWELSDLELIACGAFSPLEGFMTQRDYLSVLKSMSLSNGLIWPLPITLSKSRDEIRKVRIGQDICLEGTDGTIYGLMKIEDKYTIDREYEAMSVFGTVSEKHPGVQQTMMKGEVNLGGPITLLNWPSHAPFEHYFLTPDQTRKKFEEKGWNTIVGFQTRNPIHRAHEYIQKSALEMVDGLFIHPLVGKTKDDDIPASIRMKSYEVLLNKYYPSKHVMLSIFPAAMRYAGPREAVFHAIVRKNYGCTHFIVGRDHAGVGDFYGTYDSQKIFNQLKREQLDIEILPFEHSFYCKKCGQMATSKTCPHQKEHHVVLSGTRVRNMLKSGKKLPEEITRPEVADILIQGMASNK